MLKCKTSQERGILSPSAVSATCTSPSAEKEAACNEEVEATQQRDVQGELRKKRYHSYSSQQAEMGKYAAQHRPIAASKHFIKPLGYSVLEPTVRKLRDVYDIVDALLCN